MLYRLSYASRHKPTIILIGRLIARETGKFFLAAKTLALRDFPPADSKLRFSTLRTGWFACSYTETATQIHGLRRGANLDTASGGKTIRRRQFSRTPLRSRRCAQVSAYSCKYFIGFTGVSLTITS